MPDSSSAPINANPDVPAASSPAAVPAADLSATSASDTGVTPAATPAADAVPKVEPEVTLRDAIAEAVTPEKPKADAVPDPKAVKPVEKPAEEKRLTPEEQAAADATLPFGKHPRWKQVMGENQELRKFRDSVTPQIQEYSRITGFMQQNEIAPQEMEGLYVLAALLKHEPAKALETLRQMIEPLEQFVGEKLPEDLAAEVDDGAISVERAKEIARLRNESQFREERSTHQRERESEDQQRGLRMTQAQSVSAWEKRVAAQDPDYPVMQDLVVAELKRLQSETPARTAQEAVALAETAYKSIRSKFSAALGRSRQEIPAGPSSRDTPGNNGRQPAPSSLKDAIRQAL